MSTPDFAHTDLGPLADRDLRFLIDHFPQPGSSYEEIAAVIDRLPTTLESMLESDYVFHKILDRRTLLLDISPFLLFNVLLRRSLDVDRTNKERRVINYIANLLSLFVRTDRVYRVQPNDQVSHEYLVAMIEEANSADSDRQFLIYTHIGNYALFLTGFFPQWIEYRHRYRRRPVDTQFYIDFGRAYFERASSHPLAHEYQLDDVFFRLAFLFDDYRGALNRIAKQYLASA